MKRRALLDRGAIREVCEFAARLGYHLISLQNNPSGGKTHVVLTLEPFTLVRRTNISITNRDFFTFDGFFAWVFPDQVRRRMRLRAGSPLARSPAVRATQLEQEQARLTEFLQKEGFFEAHVKVKDTKSGRHTATIKVSINMGRRYKVGQIRVIGNGDVPAEKVRKKFIHCGVKFLPACIGRAYFRYDQFIRDVEAVAEMFRKRNYPAVRVRTDFDIRHSFKRKSKRVEFTVSIKTRRKVQVSYVGNRSYPASVLSKRLTFPEEGSYDDFEVEKSAEEIRRFYQSKGYFEAHVTWERLKREQDFERIVFSIHQGPRLPVREISFQGNRAISTRRIEDTIITKIFRQVAVFGGGFVTSIQLQQDVQRIRQLYLEAGYSAAQVSVRVHRRNTPIATAAALAATLAGNADSPGLFIRFQIREGQQKTLAPIVIAFNDQHKYQESDIRKLIRSKAGNPVREKQLKDDIDRIQRFYFRRGYPHAQVEVKQDKSSVPPVVRFTITENQPVKFGKTAIRGNFRTKKWVIEDELGFEEGAPLTLDSMETGQQNLRSTGLFRWTRIDPLGLEEKDNKVNVLVRVQERDDVTLDGEFGFGFSTDAGLFGEVGLIMPNMFGIGVRGDLRGQLGTEFRSLKATLKAPSWIARRVVGIPFLTELTMFLEQEDTLRFGSLNTIGTSITASRTIRSGRLKNWNFSFRYDFRIRQRNEPLIRGPGPNGELTETPVPTLTSSFGPQITIDRRTDKEGQPSPALPERGYLLEVRALFAEDVVLGDDRFIKLGLSAQHFATLGKQLLISNSLRYDHGIPLGGDVILPAIERFFSGGDTSVRGFEEDSLAVETIQTGLPPLDGFVRARFVPAGGNMRFIHNLETQIPIADLGGFPLASALFLDTGLVTNSFEGLSFRDFRHSVGAGIRWLFPFGALSAEWAIPLDPKLGDNPRGRFHFNVGLLF